MQYVVISQTGAPQVLEIKPVAPRKREGDEYNPPPRQRQQMALPYETTFEGDKIRQEGKGVTSILNLGNGKRYVMSDRGGTYIVQDGIQPLTLEERITKLEERLKGLEESLEAKG